MSQSKYLAVLDGYFGARNFNLHDPYNNTVLLFCMMKFRSRSSKEWRNAAMSCQYIWQCKNKMSNCKVCEQLVIPKVHMETYVKLTGFYIAFQLKIRKITPLRKLSTITSVYFSLQKCCLVHRNPLAQANRMVCLILS